VKPELIQNTHVVERALQIKAKRKKGSERLCVFIMWNQTVACGGCTREVV
jgi:hypothetical protein